MVSYSSNTTRRLCRCSSLLRATSVDNNYGYTRKVRTFDNNSQRRRPISLLSIAWVCWMAGDRSVGARKPSCMKHICTHETRMKWINANVHDVWTQPWVSVIRETRAQRRYVITDNSMRRTMTWREENWKELRTSETVGFGFRYVLPSVYRVSIRSVERSSRIARRTTRLKDGGKEITEWRRKRSAWERSDISVTVGKLRWEWCHRTNYECRQFCGKYIYIIRSH